MLFSSNKLPLTGGCFKCGKEGHMARECPDAAVNTGKPPDIDVILAHSSRTSDIVVP